MADALTSKRPEPHSGPCTSKKSDNDRSKRARTDGTDEDTPPPKTPMQTLHDKAVRLLDAGEPAEAYKLFKAALVYCTCQRTVRRQFRAAGVPLEAIDPLGQCSCKDFVAAAQKQRTSSPVSLGPVSLTASSSVPSITNLDLAAVYNLTSAVTPCTCGSGRTRCRAPGHLAALDRLAVVAARLEQASAATAAAQWYLDLAPERAQGYLHMAKAVLLAVADSSPGDPAATRFAMRCLYNHGLHNVRKYGDPDPSDRMVALLFQCCIQYGAGDYLPAMPAETAEMVFQHLALGDLVRCCRVSRKWAAMLTRLRLRLRVVKLATAGARRGGGGGGSGGSALPALQRLLHRLPGLQTPMLFLGYRDAPGATAPVLSTSSSVSIDKAKRSRAMPSQAPLITEALQRICGIETLVLNAYELLSPGQSGRRRGDRNVQTAADDPGLRRPLCPPGVLDRCRHLVLEGMLESNCGLLLGLLRSVRETVETLELEACFLEIESVGEIDFVLPKLKCLRASGMVWSHESTLLRLCVQSPNLQQLYLNCVLFKITYNTFPNLPDFDPHTVFRNLHTFVLGREVGYAENRRIEVHPSWFPILPDGMRCIDIMCNDARLVNLFLIDPRLVAMTPGMPLPADTLPPFVHSSIPANRPPVRPFARLEAFRCLTEMDDERLQRCLLDVVRPSLDPLTGRLAHLELYGGRLETSFRYDLRFAIPAPARLRTVGLHCIDWDQGYRHMPKHVFGRSYLQWLAQFTRAEVITVIPELTPEQADVLLISVVEDRLAAFRAAAAAGDDDHADRPRPLTIYHTVKRPGIKARLSALIGNYPITVIEVSTHRPPVFPWPDEAE